MNNMDIIGGVSPLKKTMRRGKSFGKRAGGTVIGDTRYVREPWKKPPSGGTTVRKVDPYKVKDPDPNTDPINIDVEADANASARSGHWEYEDIYKDVTTRTEKERPGYRAAWEAMEERNGKKYNPRNQKLYENYEDFEKEAIQWNIDNPGHKEYEETTKKVWDGQRKRWVWDDEVHSSSSSSASVTTSPGKYRLGGYKFAKKFKKQINKK